MTSKEYATIENNQDSDELVELQNENAQLNLELCTLHTNYENLEAENASLKRKNDNTYKEKYEKLLEENRKLQEQLKTAYKY